MFSWAKSTGKVMGCNELRSGAGAKYEVVMYTHFVEICWSGVSSLCVY